MADWLEESGAMRQARDTAEKYAAQAAAELRSLPDSLARRTLEDIARFVVARST